MEFVFSFWYIVAIVLVLGIVACLVLFFMMDKKDKVLIDNFVKEATAEQSKQQIAEVVAEEPAKVEEAVKTEDVTE